MNGNSFLLRVLCAIAECLFHVKSYHPVRFGVHRTFGIGDITLFIFHEAICNQSVASCGHCGR